MARIDKNTVDRIYDAVRIEEVVGDYVSLKRRGTNMLGLCPFHNEKTPSFMVSPAKGIYKCFGCGKGGNAVNFIMEVEQISYYDALKHVAAKYHIHIEEKELSTEEQQQLDDRESMMFVNEFANKYFMEQMNETAMGRSVALGYFKQRGFTDQIIEKFQLGYAPDGKDIFTQHAVAHGYKEKYLDKTGLSIIKDDWKRDRFAGRVIFPIHGQSGKVIAFAGRTLSTDKTIAKYLNSPESEIYHKSDVLYGIFQAKKEIQRKDNCFLVEGYTDVMSLHQSGIENVVASSGTSLTKGQIRLVKRFTNNITVIYDGDNAGIKASLRGIDLLLEEGMNVKVLLLPDGEDPDSFAKSMGASELQDYIDKNCTDFIHFKTNLLNEGTENDPMKKVKLIEEVVGSIAVIPNEIARSVYLKTCSLLLDVAEDMLLRECNKVIAKKYAEKQKELERERNRNRLQQGTDDVPPADFGMPADIEPLVSPTTASKPVSSVVVDDKKFLEERVVLTFLLRYGDLNMFNEDDQYYKAYPDLTVSDYIIAQLDEDELTFEYPLYKSLYEEYKVQKEQGTLNIQRYFIQHEDGELSSLCVDLTASRHERSRIFEADEDKDLDESKLGILVPRVITEFKLRWVMKELKSLNEILATSKDEATLDEAFAQLRELNEAKKALSNALGGRTLLGR